MTVPSPTSVELGRVTSQRSSVVAVNGAVATSSPLAAQAGLRVLQAGGNAVDAAIAATAVLGVVEPMSTGIGGDIFALLWSDGAAVSFNGSGRSPRAASVEALSRAGHGAVPEDGPGAVFSVSVPGAVDGWEALLRAHGSMQLDTLLVPAIEYARDGFPVPAGVSATWRRSAATLRDSDGDLLAGGQGPGPGEVVCLPHLARTLELIAREGPAVLYQGEVGDRVAEHVASLGGWLTREDLAGHVGEWGIPMGTRYRDVELLECPPNGQGIAALVAAAIATGLDTVDRTTGGPEWMHVLLEAMKSGLADALAVIGDDANAADRALACLDPPRIDALRRAISDRASPPISPPPFGPPRDTAHVSVIDGDGNGASVISSLFRAFGSGVVVPGTGIVLQNRGALFSMDPSHPSFLTGGRRPFHTIIPAMILREGQLWSVFGVVGGFQQAQAHLQLLSGLVDRRLSPQEALDAVRFSIDVEQDGLVRFETGTDPAMVEELRRRGHRVAIRPVEDSRYFGGGQILVIDPATSVISGGSDARRDGLVAAW